MIEQEKADGRIHRHAIWSRVDLETGRARPDGWDSEICHAASKAIREELGLPPIASPFDKDREGPRPKRAPKRWEMYRGMKSGIDPRAITAQVTELYHQSDNGRAFHAALEQHGYVLAKGDRRGWVIIDSAGDDHSLARRIEGVNTKELNAFMRDVDHEALPTVEQGRAQRQERTIAALDADRATVRDEIRWEEALDRAGIEKEERERKFVEPMGREGKEERHWPVAAPDAERKSPNLFEEAGRQATDDHRVENLKGPAAQVWKLWTRIDPEKLDFSQDAAFSVETDRKAFAEALDQKGIGFARATKDEADRSHREASFAKAVGNFAPRFREGEIVIVTAPRPEYRREGQIVEPPRVHKIDPSLADKFVKALGAGHELKGIDVTKEVLLDRARERAAEWEGIRLENATKSRRRGKGRAATPAAPDLGKASAQAIGSVFGVLGKLADGFSLDALTPKEKYEAAKRDHANEKEADKNEGFAAYIADLAEARLEQQREVAQQRDREPERERDR